MHFPSQLNTSRQRALVRKGRTGLYPFVSCAPGSLSLKSVSDWEAAASASAKTRLAHAVLTHSDLTSAFVRCEAVIADVHVFNTELDFKTGPITDQKRNGCP